MRVACLCLALGAACASSSPSQPVEVVPEATGENLTQRHDPGRTGANDQESILTPQNVGRLVLRRRFPVDDQVYAQPLVVADVGGKNLLLIATMANTLAAYDFDAPDGTPPLWQLGADALGTPGMSPRNVGGRNGILGTPTVDKPRGLVFAVSRDCTAGCAFHVWAIRLADGTVADHTDVSGAVTSTAGDAVVFDPAAHWNRPGLLLAGGRLFAAFGSGPADQQHEEDFVYHGWLFSFDASDLASAPTVFCTTPDGRGGSIWQGGSGVAADEDHVYVAGANGIMGFMTFPPSSFPATPRGAEDSIARLPIGAPATMDARYWDDRPYHDDGNVFQYMESGDNGFGSAAPTIIPGARDLLATGKSGMVYLVDRDFMTARQTPLLPFTELPLQPGHSLYIHSWWGIPFTTSLAFFRPANATVGFAYGWAGDDLLKSFRYDYRARTLAVAATAPVVPIGTGSSGGGQIVTSSNGGDPTTALVWAASRPATDSPMGRVWAFDASSLAELWHADTPSLQKLTAPTVVRGHLLVAATSGDEKAILDFGLP